MRAHPRHSTALVRRLRRVIDEAGRFVPFYAELWRRAGIDRESLHLPEDLQRLPIIGKAELRAFGSEERIDRRYRDGRPLTIERSSGSTGEPVDMYLDADSLRRRRWRFWRALLSSGYRPGQRLLLLSSQSSAAIERRRAWMQRFGWFYADASSSSASLLSAYRVSRPHVLYGPLSSLLVLGQELIAERRVTHRPAALISTAEQLTSTHRRLLQQFFGTEVSDYYGMTELGLVAWRRPRDLAYRLEERSFLFEFLPVEGVGGLERLIVTDLHGGAMPWIRFDTGDLVRRDHSRAAAPLLEFTGRVIDCLLLPGRRRLSPHRLLAALEELSGIERFEVIQHEDSSVDVHIWSPLATVAPLLERAQVTVREVCEGLLAVRVHHRTDPLAASAVKLRPVRSYAGAAE